MTRSATAPPGTAAILPETLWHGTTEARALTALHTGYLQTFDLLSWDVERGQDRPLAEAETLHLRSLCLTRSRAHALWHARYAAHRETPPGRPLLVAISRAALHPAALRPDPVSAASIYGACATGDNPPREILDGLSWQAIFQRCGTVKYADLVRLTPAMLDISALDQPLPDTAALAQEEATGRHPDPATRPRRSRFLDPERDRITELPEGGGRRIAPRFRAARQAAPGRPAGDFAIAERALPAITDPATPMAALIAHLHNICRTGRLDLEPADAIESRYRYRFVDGDPLWVGVPGERRSAPPPTGACRLGLTLMTGHELVITPHHRDPGRRAAAVAAIGASLRDEPPALPLPPRRDPDENPLMPAVALTLADPCPTFSTADRPALTVTLAPRYAPA